MSKQPKVFLSGPRTHMGANGKNTAEFTRTILAMDLPEHRNYRGLVSSRFTPNAMRRIYEQVDEITHGVLDRASTNGETREADFVETIAARTPIWVIAEMIGVPPDHWEQLYRWTNEIIGANDPEYQAGRTGAETRIDARTEVFEYFKELAAERRAEPRDDLASLLVHAEIDGQKLSEFELLSYFVILMGAGNETTRNATTGGMLQLIENPDQFERLRRSPALLDASSRRRSASSLRSSTSAARPTATSMWAARRFRRVKLWCSSTPPRTATRPSSTDRTSSTSVAIRTRTWRSGSASTSAWARTSPASSFAPSFAT